VVDTLEEAFENARRLAVADAVEVRELLKNPSKHASSSYAALALLEEARERAEGRLDLIAQILGLSPTEKWKLSR
jgi:hypothetical protein